MIYQKYYRESVIVLLKHRKRNEFVLQSKLKKTSAFTLIGQHANYSSRQDRKKI